MPNVDTDADLDELDEVLDQFAAPQPTSPVTSPPPPPTATQSSFASAGPTVLPNPLSPPSLPPSSRPRTNTRVGESPLPAPGNGPPLSQLSEAAEDDIDADALASDFAAELAKGMESLMREMATENASKAAAKSPDAPTSEPEFDETALRAAWEALLVEGMNNAGAPGSDPSPVPGSSASSAAPQSSDFQSAIRAAMGKVREGEATMGDQSAADPSADSLEAMLSQLGLGGGGEGDLDENALAGILENMMGELMSKDVLYEPLKELGEKFPPYLAAHSPSSPAADAEPLSQEEFDRYTAQIGSIKTLLKLFEAPDYVDNEKSREKIVALVAEMQSHGSPPSELMGPLPPGLGALGGMGNLFGGEGDGEGCLIA
ncbi:unnamed protein product [Mycena citricolor]|uniref:Uncharacterized protein n=1 Tax=Mycena citricolor TaxID=2018698 RepID=A0AAD2K092_9AGAR|nr:unnamed protein product [Mycena citricolor]